MKGHIGGMRVAMTDAEVVIAGGGLAGLSAAVRLHRAGVSATICEAGDDVGGRVRTERTDGFLLDRGFQVLLPAYPELRRLADLGALRLRPFRRGVLAMTGSGRQWLTGPWHGQQAAAGLARFLRGHGADGAALAALSLRDIIVPSSAIRGADPVATTGDELRGRFSTATIAEVLRPFLAGVFLDPSLDTPARLFHLLWRCFLRGGAAIPEDGMQALPRQLAASLPPGTVRTATRITHIGGSGVRTAAGQDIAARAVVIATDGDTAAMLAPRVARAAVACGHHLLLPAPGIARARAGPDYRRAGRVAAQYRRAQRRLPQLCAGRRCPGRRVRTRPRGPHPRTQGPGSAGPALRHRHSRLGAAADLRDPPRAARPACGRAAGPPGTARPGRYVCGDHRDTPSIQGALVSGRRAADAVLADLRGPASRR
jgi:glycine/D-amino acid oxidase-like deaminating enzyme